jgi:hypothetical protein
MTKIQNLKRFGHCVLEFIWNLVLEIWDLKAEYQLHGG